MKRRLPQIPYPHIAVCVDQFRSHGRGVMRGIAKYVETYGPWSLFIDPLADSKFSHGRSENWRGDGILTYIDERPRAARLRASAIPTVELFAHRNDGLLPLVAHDDFAVGKLAAEHLATRHFRHFAYCGYSGSFSSAQRQRGFTRALLDSGCASPHTLSITRPQMIAEWETAQQELTAWLLRLPKPIGLMACTDHHAHRILDACQRVDIVVPEEVAVVGVDNDEEICRLSNPPLTSVILNSERVGYDGAALLDQLMRKKIRRDKVKPSFIAPLGLVTRRSTDVMAITDPLIAEAARAIRDKACQGLAVDELLKQFKISRSIFYQRFQNALGRSPHYEILRVQLDRVKNLLTQTSLPLKKIAEMAGFDNPNYLSVAFKREIGATPGNYRKEHNGR